MLATLTGVPPLTLWRVFTAWRLDPATLLVTALLGGGYLLALRRRRPTAAWPRGRTAGFLCGVATIGVVGSSFLAVYADVLFWPRAVQNVTLLMITPLLLALGAPLRLVADVLPPQRRAVWARRLRSPTARRLTFPPVITVVLVAPMLVLYLTGLYEASLRSPVVGGLVQLLLVTCGFVYFWSRLRIDPTPRAGHHGVTLWITIAEMVGDAVVGLALWFGPLVAADYYVELARTWGPSMRVDQIIGAGVIWIGGDVAGLPFIGIVMALMTRDDARTAAIIDAQLDAQEAAVAAGTGAEGENGAADAGPRPSRLWWEDDPELSQRFRRR